MKNTIILNENQVELLSDFLTDISEGGKPKNWIEWGEEWLIIHYLANNINDVLIDDELRVSDDEYFAIFNYMTQYITLDIKVPQKGEKLFDDYSKLFIYLKDVYEAEHPERESYSPYVFIPKFYVDNTPPKKVYVDPNATSDEILNILKTG